MTIRTGRQFPLPNGSSLALLGECSVPYKHIRFTGSETGLAILVELRCSQGMTEDQQAVCLHKLFKTIVAYVWHGCSEDYAGFDPLVLRVDSTEGEPFVRILLRIKASLMDNESYCRKFAKSITRCWEIVQWAEDAEARSGSTTSAVGCPLLPLDLVCFALDWTLEKLISREEKLFYWARRWVGRMIDRKVWSSYYSPDEQKPEQMRLAENWLVGEGYLLRDNDQYTFTDKFVRACWKDALEYKPSA